MGERPYGRTTRGSRAVTIESLRFHAQSTTLAPLPPVTIPHSRAKAVWACVKMFWMRLKGLVGRCTRDVTDDHPVGAIFSPPCSDTIIIVPQPVAITSDHHHRQ